MNDLFPAVGKAPKVKEVQAIAFYEHDGRIHHMHHVIVLDGARPVEYEAMLKEACEQAEILGVDVSRLETLHVTELKNPHVMYRVDVKTRVLVEAEAPKPCFKATKGPDTFSDS